MSSRIQVYLTIDDAPSRYLSQKIDFLKKHQIPAVLFCRGSFIPKYQKQIVYAIQNGFLIGNHSYSHPYFSKISFDQCRTEILKTEELIESCYEVAEQKRPVKVIRLPFGDRGEHHSEAIQQFLQKEGFKAFDFGLETHDGYIDTPWTWDSYDYKKKYIQDLYQYQLELQKRWFHTGVFKPEVLMLHDFEDNRHLFEYTLHFLMQQNVEFLPFKLR